MFSSPGSEIVRCAPLDSMEAVMLFLRHPPPWRSLCKELCPHSELKVINMSVNAGSAISVEEPRTFCHTNLSNKPVISSLIGVRQDKKNLPQTLVCHDMANGYHDDCVVQGTQNVNAYTFYNWAGIDIFCYFSHHFVTIPPLGWINVAHAHGVKVIGTVITEWSSGAQFWDELLSNDVHSRNFASVLVAIARTLKFEGWLLNIENKVSEPQKLIQFVKYFHKILHEEVKNAELIWYDSVTVEGKLNWQNGLTELNREFFNACDGLFTNYTWTVEGVMSSVHAAGDRSRDLYIGIDVWGRNFFGGGMFNTQQAIDVTYQFDCSIAIFAPAWTFEAMNQTDAPETSLLQDVEMAPYERFYLRDKAFWDSLWPYLYTNLPNHLPFQTSFCRGHGLRYWHYGEVISGNPWYKLIRMQYQPNANHGAHGYTLSTLDNYQEVSDSGIDLKTTGGIVQYRQNISAKQKLGDSTSDIPEPEPEMSSMVRRDSNKSIGTVIPAKVTMKNKIKSFFTCIFGRKKTSSTSSNKDACNSRNASPTNDSEEYKKSPRVEIDAPTTSREVRGAPQQEAYIEETVDSIPHLGSSASLQPKAQRFEISKRSLRKLTRLDSLQIMLRGSHMKTRYALDIVPQELSCMQQYFDDCFNGGSCLKINPSDDAWPLHRSIRLFYCHFQVVKPLVICVVTKTLDQNEKQYLNVHLQLKRHDGRRVELRLIGKDSNRQPNKLEKVYGHGEIYNVYSLPLNSKLFKNLQSYLLLSDPGFYIPVNNIYGWKVRYFELTVPWSRLVAIDLVTSRTKGPILLGYLGITERTPGSETDAPVPDSAGDVEVVDEDLIQES